MDRVYGDAGSGSSSYLATVQKSGIGVYRWNPVTAELLWDAASARIFVADRPGETPFETWMRRIHAEDHERVRAVSSQPSTTEVVYRLVMDDGSIRHVLARTTQVLRGANGSPAEVHGVILDVTEAQRAAAQLAATLDSISDGFIALDHKFCFVYMNRKSEQLLGMDFKSLAGRSLWEAFPHALGTHFERVYRKVMTDRVPAAFVERYPEPLNMWIEVRAEPSEQGIVVYFQNVTARREQEEERERLLLSEQGARRAAEAARSEAEAAQRELQYLATHDPLTGMVNRSEFERIAAQKLRETAAPVTALFLDLDRFKLVNDSLGHAVGDALLVEVASRLGTVQRAGDVAARLGGDEFVVLLVGSSPTDSQGVAERILDLIRDPFEIGHYSLSTTVSIGMATANRPATLPTLLRNADVALYRAKDAGGDSSAWFDAAAHQNLLDRISLETDLRAVLDGDSLEHSLELYYQPIFSLPEQELVGVEALARWFHPTRGAIPPDLFIPVAEDAGLMKRLGAAVNRVAIQQAARWSDRPNFTVWINVSGRQLDTPGFARDLLREIAVAGLAPDRLGVEVTESVLADEVVAGRELAALSAAGIAIAIDDFGTGYSSLGRLAALPIHVLKIDRSFVERIETRSGRAAVDVTIHLARSLGLLTVAEGVETVRELELVKAAGADRVAGFLLARPTPAEELFSSLHAN